MAYMGDPSSNNVKNVILWHIGVVEGHQNGKKIHGVKTLEKQDPSLLGCPIKNVCRKYHLHKEKWLMYILCCVVVVISNMYLSTTGTY